MAATLSGTFITSSLDVSLVSTSGLCGRRSVSLSGAVVPWKATKRGFRGACFAHSGPSSSVVTNIPSLYSLLGLEQSVALPEIKNAYRQMARKYHPDVCPPENREECTKMFLQVQDAYETLSDPARRADYDFSLMQTMAGNGRALGYTGKSGKGQRRNGVDPSTTESWKTQWESQLNNMRVRETDQNSWGARMRARQQQEAA